MQITLVQHEIETAIREYVHTQINVKEGMEIDIVLKATRGDEGTTAIIDIHQSKTPTPAAATAAVRKETAAAPAAQKVVQAVKEKPAAAAAGLNQAAQSTGQAGNATESQQDNAASTAGATTQAATSASAAGEDQQADEQKTETPAGQTEQVGGASDNPAPARKSLFGGLTKPVNN